MSHRRTTVAKSSPALDSSCTLSENNLSGATSSASSASSSVYKGSSGINAVEIDQGTVFSLDGGKNIDNFDVDLSYDEIEPLSAIDELELSDEKRRLKHWKESSFACGLTEPTWKDERNRSIRSMSDDTGCLMCSAYICPLLGAGRVGNMAVLKSSVETLDVVIDDDTESGQAPITRRITRPKLDLVVGPYWPMLCCVTYPLIFIVSGWAFIMGIYNQNLPIVFVLFWAICTISLIVALACTACRDPGILRRVRHVPPEHVHTWRWSDQADSFRPRTAWYDGDTAVIVEGFDHTCPWTGTAIGKKNMLAFQTFVCLIFLCMLLDIIILTGAMAK